MGDSDMFSLEMPGTLSSKKSSDSLHLVDSLGDIHPLDAYNQSPKEARRRGETGLGNRRRRDSPRSFHDVEFGTSANDFSSNEDDLEVDETHTRRRGLSALGEAATSSTASMEYYDDRSIVADFLRQYHCTSMMPQSSKVVVLDTGISIRAAFHALDENDIDSAPLWDATEHDFTGVVTIGDILAALLAQIPDVERIEPASVLAKLETTTLKQWMAKRSENRDLVCMEPSDSLFEALSMLSRFKVHRVPVIDRLEQNTILYVLTATKIVVFLMKIMAKRPALFETSLEKIQVGRFSQLSTALPTFTLYEVLQMIEKTHYSAIPIVDSDGTLIDTLYKADLARIPPGDLLTFLNTSIAQVLRSWREKGLLRTYTSNTCTMDASMEVVLTTLMDSHLRSLVVVDSSRHIRGIVALTDILRCFLV